MPTEKPKTGIISGGQTQREIDGNLRQMLEAYEGVFQGIGVARVEPIHNEMDTKIKPVQYRRRPIAIHYLKKFKAHVEELKAAGVVSGPLKSESARGWIHSHNPDQGQP